MNNFLCNLLAIEQKGMTFGHDFDYSFPLFTYLLKKGGREKENEVAKVEIKSHAFLLDPFLAEMQLMRESIMMKSCIILN